MDLTATQQLLATQMLSENAREPAAGPARRLRHLAECLPFAYITAGFTAFFATLYVPEWYWVMPYYFLSGCALVHLGLLALEYRRRPSNGPSPE